MTSWRRLPALLLPFVSLVLSQTPAYTTSAITPASTTLATVTGAAALAKRANPESVTGCHMHGATQYCLSGSDEYQIMTSASKTEELPSQYTSCHNHGSDLFCLSPDGDDVEIQLEGAEDSSSSTLAAPTSITEDSRSSTSAAPASITAGSASSTSAAPASITEPPDSVTGCHMHGVTQFCLSGTAEYVILTSATRTEELPSQYTGCHSHGSDTFCISPNGDEVEIQFEGAEESSGGEEGGGERNCHFHAGVEHCVGGDASEEKSCAGVERDYNIPLRIGLIFVILITSGIGVFGPIFTASFTKIKTSGTIFVMLKQFGTGVIISTAFVHLFTHASLMFGNECLGELAYEATTAAILMAGLFLSFLVEYLGHRFILWRQGRRSDARTESLDQESNAQHTSDKGQAEADATAPVAPQMHSHVGNVERSTLSVMVLEAGIIFHSILIGITLVVAGDSFFLTLFAVIIFHQMFEGIALGVCISALPPSAASFIKKCIMATAFTLVTPIGMAIGIGVLNTFNGNDKSTIIAIGTLDAFSAGILVWVGVVEMWAHDWLYGHLVNAGAFKTTVGLVSLLAGMALMSLLGKWA